MLEVNNFNAVRITPSRIGLLLDVTPRLLEQVLYFAKYIITDVNDQARERLIKQIQEETERRIEARERERTSRLEEATGPLMNRLAELEDEKTQRLRDLEEERDRMVNWVGESGTSLKAEIDSLIGQVTEDDITFSPNDTVIVRAGET